MMVQPTSDLHAGFSAVGASVIVAANEQDFAAALGHPNERVGSDPLIES
jgi:hypothetical protein